MRASSSILLVFSLLLKRAAAQSNYIYPKAVNATSGFVSNATALLSPNSSVATLSGAGAQIVLDYGVTVGGFPTIWLDSVEGEGIQLAMTYSEGVYCLLKSS